MPCIWRALWWIWLAFGHVLVQGWLCSCSFWLRVFFLSLIFFSLVFSCLILLGLLTGFVLLFSLFFTHCLFVLSVCLGECECMWIMNEQAC